MGELIMKKYSIFFAASLAAFAVSCSKAELTETLVKDGYTSFTATMGDALDPTRTALDETTGAISWTEGDAIKIFWNEGDQHLSAVSEPLTAQEASASPVKFMAECTPSGNVYAVYPSTVTAEKIDYVHVTVPAVQNGVFADNAILAAKLIDGKFNFQNVCGYLQFSVPAGVTKVVWSADGSAALAGKVKVGFPDGISVEGVLAGTGETNVTVNVSGAGTYYAAVAPGKYSTMYVAMFNGDELVGEKQTFNTVEVGRAQVKKMGTMPADGTVIADKVFVKVAGAGSKDGSSWDNAMDLAAFKAAITSTAANGKTYYLAAGTYDAGAEMSLGQDITFKMMGGYPADAAGGALTGRDVRANETVFTGKDSYRIFVVTKGTITYDGLVFEHAYRVSKADAGTAIIMQGCGDQTINNCVFRNNTNAAGAGGAIRVVPAVGKTASITNCLFENNTAKVDGGVIVMTQGNLISRNNVYRHNIMTDPWTASAEHGGGVLLVKDAAAGTTLYFENDLFDGNRAMADWSKSPADGASGSVAYLKNVKTGGSIDFRCNGCSFINNRAKTRGCVRCANLGASSKVMLNACSFARDTVADYGSAVHTQNVALVHNCVFFQNVNSQASGASQIYYDNNVCVSNTSIRLGGNSSVGIRNNGGVGSVIVNNIIYNGMKGSAIYVASGKTLTSYGHNIYNNSAVSDASAVISGDGTFAVAAPDAHADAIYTADLAWKGLPSCWLEFNVWPDGAGPENFTLCSPARVEAAIDAFDTTTGIGAKAWLNEIGALNTDRRGVQRSSTAIWPGSYDKSAEL